VGSSRFDIVFVREMFLVTVTSPPLRARSSTWNTDHSSRNSALELNVAILVSSAPGFSKYFNAHFLELPLVKSLLSSFSSHSRSATHDSEVAISEKPPRSAEAVPRPTQDRSRRYYELNDTWMLKTDASADPMPPSATYAGGGQIHGIAQGNSFGQTQSTSTESLMR
jgi:hypothetical protein